MQYSWAGRVEKGPVVIELADHSRGPRQAAPARMSGAGLSVKNRAPVTGRGADQRTGAHRSAGGGLFVVCRRVGSTEKNGITRGGMSRRPACGDARKSRSYRLRFTIFCACSTMTGTGGLNRRSSSVVRLPELEPAARQSVKDRSRVGAELTDVGRGRMGRCRSAAAVEPVQAAAACAKDKRNIVGARRRGCHGSDDMGRKGAAGQRRSANRWRAAFRSRAVLFR
jgi:hypothetical protein